MTAATICEPVTLDEIDEALAHAAGCSVRDWHWINALLDQRTRMTR